MDTLFYMRCYFGANYKIRDTLCFYNINERLEIAIDVQLQTGDYLLITNYWGLKDAYVGTLSQKYGKQLIVDNAQAFYAISDMNIKTIYSPRKFVGVPDGGIAFVDNGLEIDALEKDISYERCSHLLKRIDLGANAGYIDFKENSHKLANQPIRRMSNLTEAVLSSVDWENIRKKEYITFRYYMQPYLLVTILSFHLLRLLYVQWYIHIYQKALC